jgi:hypothetical protein
LYEKGFHLILCEWASDEFLELLVRKTTLLGHLTDEVVTEGFVAGAEGRFCPHGSLAPRDRVIGEKSMVAFGKDKALSFKARFDVASLKRHSHPR